MDITAVYEQESWQIRLLLLLWYDLRPVLLDGGLKLSTLLVTLFTNENGCLDGRCLRDRLQEVAMHMVNMSSWKGDIMTNELLVAV